MGGTDYGLISSYCALLTLATLSVYAGSFGSLSSKEVKGKSTGKGEEDDDDEDEDFEVSERLSSEDAYLFPIIGSVVLFGLYMVVKYFGKEWINRLLGWYFSIAGVGSVWKASLSLMRWTLGRETYRKFSRFNFQVMKDANKILSLKCRTPALILIPLSAIPSLWFSLVKRDALTTNILGLSFSFSALSLLKLDSFSSGVILLSGLFLYDIWWVFGTEVMVKVATSLDVPIKILWPKSLSLSSARGFTLLGIGDIVIPGTFCALALRFDHAKFSAEGKSFKRPYFSAAILAYTGGLATTMVVMHTFRAAQPALLYLSPACILSFVITAMSRGEFKEAWNWSDSPENSKKSEGVSGESAIKAVKSE